MCSKWVEKIDSEGNKILINPKVVYVLKESFDENEHLAYLFEINTKRALKIAYMKKIIRIIISVICFVPSIPVFWITYSLFGLGFVMGAHSFLAYPLSYLLNDDKSMKENIETINFTLEIIYTPLFYWNNFIKGDLKGW